MLEDENPALRHFLGAYLHQDWRDEYADSFDALDDFLLGSPPLALLIGPEIDRLIQESLPSEDLERRLFELGSYYMPSLLGQDPSTWLRELRARILESHGSV